MSTHTNGSISTHIKGCVSTRVVVALMVASSNDRHRSSHTHGHQFKLTKLYILAYKSHDIRARCYSSSDSCTCDRRQLTRSAIDLPLGLAPDLDGTRAGTTATTSCEGMV